MTAILIVDDLAEARAWLSDFATRAFPGPHRVQAVATRAGGLDAVTTGAFDVALINLQLPAGSGIDVLRSLHRRGAGTLSVVTTVLGDDAHIVAALSAGADGYLLKSEPPQTVIRQLSQLADGIPALSPPIARRIMGHFQMTGPVEAADDLLTGRERQVLGLIGRGMRNQDVSEHLSLSPHTVASHIKSVYRKLGIASRAEASWHATLLGLTARDIGGD